MASGQFRECIFGKTTARIMAKVREPVPLGVGGTALSVEQIGKVEMRVLELQIDCPAKGSQGFTVPASLGKGDAEIVPRRPVGAVDLNDLAKPLARFRNVARRE